MSTNSDSSDGHGQKSSDVQPSFGSNEDDGSSTVNVEQWMKESPSKTSILNQCALNQDTSYVNDAKHKLASPTSLSNLQLKDSLFDFHHQLRNCFSNSDHGSDMHNMANISNSALHPDMLMSDAHDFNSILNNTPQCPSCPEYNSPKLLTYREHRLAAFTIDNFDMLCLPQAFELFLRNLVGGLHTVYTKLKRLGIVPLVCNVEQVRALRGLGAIAPGVNRCKLIRQQDFELLYEDCTNSCSRPGRPPKRSTPFSSPDPEHNSERKLPKMALRVSASNLPLKDSRLPIPRQPLGTVPGHSTLGPLCSFPPYYTPLGMTPNPLNVGCPPFHYATPYSPALFNSFLSNNACTLTKFQNENFHEKIREHESASPGTLTTINGDGRNASQDAHCNTQRLELRHSTSSQSDIHCSPRNSVSRTVDHTSAQQRTSHISGAGDDSFSDILVPSWKRSGVETGVLLTQAMTFIQEALKRTAEMEYHMEQEKNDLQKKYNEERGLRCSLQKQLDEAVSRNRTTHGFSKVDIDGTEEGSHNNRPLSMTPGGKEEDEEEKSYPQKENKISSDFAATLPRSVPHPFSRPPAFWPLQSPFLPKMQTPRNTLSVSEFLEGLSAAAQKAY